MEIKKNDQTAGDNSTQVQADIVNNYYNTTNIVGITEDRARDICREEFEKVRAVWTFEAQESALKRAGALEDKLMPKMLAHDKSLKIFGDPGFQIVLRKALRAAISSGDNSDLEMLSELIVHRAEQNGKRDRTLGITKAIEIIDQVPEPSLVGVSYFFAINTYTPTNIHIDLHDGLSTLDKLFCCILDGSEAPLGTQWIEDMSLLSAIRISSTDFHRFMRFDDYIVSKLSQCLPMGVKRDSDEYYKMLSDLNSVGLVDKNEKLVNPPEMFVGNNRNIQIQSVFFKEHPLREDYLLFVIPPSIFTSDSTLSFPCSIGTREIDIKADRTQINVLKELSELTYKDGSHVESLRINLLKEWDKFENLRNVHAWWNQLPMYFKVTQLGEALANAYNRIKYPQIPVTI